MKVSIFVRKNIATIALFIGVLFIVGCIFVVFFLCTNHFFPISEEAGQFGDQFGALNAFFSALAFAGLIYTVWLQKKELNLQREELRLTRDEMKSQSREFETQNKTMKLQRFENTFFQMLNLQNQIVCQLNLDTGVHMISSPHVGYSPQVIDTRATIFNGRDVFCQLFNDDRLGSRNLKWIIENEGIKGLNNSNLMVMFEHYMLNLFTILDFIDRSDDSVITDKHEYAKILRASLSNYELVLLFYYNLADSRNYNLKGLVEKYTMLKYLDKTSLTLCNEIQRKYVNTEDKDIFSYLDANNSCPTDYYFFINVNENCNSGYHLSAFYEDDEKVNAVKKIEYFQKVLSDYYK